MVKLNVKSDFSEIVNYIIPQYPIYIKDGFLSQYHNYAAVSHWHEDIEMIYVLSGAMKYDVNGEVLLLQEGEGIIVNSRNFHYGFSETKKECEFLCILIHPSILAGNTYIYEHYVLPFTECESIRFLRLGKSEKWQAELLEEISAIFRLNQKLPEFYIKCQQLVLSIFEKLYMQSREILEAESSQKDDALEQLRRMVRYIQKEYQAKMTLSDIAKAGNMSKTACCNAFKKYMHTSPIDYLLSYRLSQSTVMLAETDLSITEIAYQAGFHNASYYTKYFHNYYGKTPRQMRKDIAAGD